mmetsp:Transcript_20218/g.50517  ORF Transcript_20218/g.50517 Transcript_20218/m.50517 type:complete len:973 (+) Transcript_20218:82-3000(+)
MPEARRGTDDDEGQCEPIRTLALDGGAREGQPVVQVGKHVGSAWGQKRRNAALEAAAADDDLADWDREDAANVKTKSAQIALQIDQDAASESALVTEDIAKRKLEAKVGAEKTQAIQRYMQAKTDCVSEGKVMVAEEREALQQDLPAEMVEALDQLADLDQNGDGKYSVFEVLELLKKHNQVKRSKRDLRRGLAAAGIAVLILCGVLFGVTCFATYSFKDSFVDSEGVMVDASGEIVQTRPVTSFASLFDLPSFDITTLSHVTELTLALSGGRHASFHIRSVMKQSPFVVEFFVAGGKIAVDSRASLALVLVDGERFEVDGVIRRRRLEQMGMLAKSSSSARLYSEQEFFVPEHGFTSVLDKERRLVSRRLVDGAETRGWAALSIIAAEAALDHTLPDSIVPTSHVVMAGSLLVDRTKPDGRTSPESAEIQFVYNVSTSANATGRPNITAMHIYLPDRVSALLDVSANMMYEFDVHTSTLKGCHQPDFAIPQQGSDLASLEPALEGQHLFHVSSGELGRGLQMFSIKSGYPAVDGAIPPVLHRPSAEACTRAYLAALAGRVKTVRGAEEDEEAEAEASVVELDHAEGVNETAVFQDDPPAGVLDNVSDGSGNESNLTVGGAGRRLFIFGRRRYYTWSSYWVDDGEPFNRFQDVSSEDLITSGHASTLPGDHERLECSTDMGGYAKIFKKVHSCVKVQPQVQKYWLYCGGRYCGRTWSSGRTQDVPIDNEFSCDLWVLEFRGSDELEDAVTDLSTDAGGPGNRYHSGFYLYTVQLAQACVTRQRQKLIQQLGHDLHFVTGHSLGGAAATIYAQEYGNAELGVVTWGAPKTNHRDATLVKGVRIWHWEDPVVNSLCWNIFFKCEMAHLRHAVENHVQVKAERVCQDRSIETIVEKNVEKCDWWNPFCWIEIVEEIVVEVVTECYDGDDKNFPQSPQTENPSTNFFSMTANIAKHYRKAYAKYPSVQLKSYLQWT